MPGVRSGQSEPIMSTGPGGSALLSRSVNVSPCCSVKRQRLRSRWITSGASRTSVSSEAEVTGEEQIVTCWSSSFATAHRVSKSRAFARCTTSCSLKSSEDASRVLHGLFPGIFVNRSSSGTCYQVVNNKPSSIEIIANAANAAPIISALAPVRSIV